MSDQTPPPLPPLVRRIVALRVALEAVAYRDGLSGAELGKIAADALDVDARSAAYPVKSSGQDVCIPDGIAALRRFVQRVEDGLLTEYLTEEMSLARDVIRRADRVPLKIREIPF